MKFLALSALAAFGFMTRDSEASLIGKDLFGNFGFPNPIQNPLQTNLAPSNPILPGLPNPLNFGQPSPINQKPLNSLGFPSVPLPNRPFGTLIKNPFDQNPFNSNQFGQNPSNQNPFNNGQE